MDMGDKPVLPYVLRNSKYCGERPNCEASMLQAEGLFSITLNYHHDKYEVLYKTGRCQDVLRCMGPCNRQHSKRIMGQLQFVVRPNWR